MIITKMAIPLVAAAAVAGGFFTGGKVLGADSAQLEVNTADVKDLKAAVKQLATQQQEDALEQRELRTEVHAALKSLDRIESKLGTK